MPQAAVKRTPKAPRQEPRRLDAASRVSGCAEVELALDANQARLEALRCLDCKDPTCVEACPLHIDIRSFIRLIVEGDFEGALEKISERSPFPAICGRVCQHELYCEKACKLGKKLQPVAIGDLERFAAGFEGLRPAASAATPAGSSGQPWVALVGSGPASLLAAHDLARLGYRVRIFEALHDFGGVLRYGVPPFRLPRDILDAQIHRLRQMGVEFCSNFVVGKTCSLDELFREGHQAVFLATGAGVPHLMGIPGENLVGVYTANEFLTRLNLMEAYRFPDADTPVRAGQRAVIVGGGNAAMDAARWARRLGCETTILFRRGRSELRARLEEITRAEEEGVRFEFLAAPVRIIGDEAGLAAEVECIRMRLGEPDESGRPAPAPIEGSEFRIAADLVVEAIGQSPNQTLQRATPSIATQRGKIAVDEAGRTSVPRVFAGGDVARGGSTVILAMRDGRAAADAIHRALSQPVAEASA
ncbi:MAG TPA: NADPH-dependent glutamate synthase [Bryobacterales bacterium]|nr:NADPH-dependent glutamate synthase [Bryobacterales bacterium]